jgi:small subunit ribosomal protein S20
MARHASAERQHRYSLRRNKVNKKNSSALRTEIKKVRALIENQDKEGARKALPLVYAAIDKTVKKGTVHDNKGARHKSRLARQVEKISPAASK